MHVCECVCVSMHVDMGEFTCVHISLDKQQYIIVKTFPNALYKIPSPPYLKVCLLSSVYFFFCIVAFYIYFIHKYIVSPVRLFMPNQYLAD